MIEPDKKQKPLQIKISGQSIVVTLFLDNLLKKKTDL